MLLLLPDSTHCFVSRLRERYACNNEGPCTNAETISDDQHSTALASSSDIALHISATSHCCNVTDEQRAELAHLLPCVSQRVHGGYGQQYDAVHPLGEVRQAVQVLLPQQPAPPSELDTTA